MQEALSLAYDSHAGQLRKSGEKYITHPVEVARILAELQMDAESLVAGLLHDTVEDTDAVSFEEIEVCISTLHLVIHTFHHRPRERVNSDTGVFLTPPPFSAHTAHNRALCTSTSASRHQLQVGAGIEEDRLSRSC